MILDGKSGFLVDPQDINTMADYMLKLARDLCLREKMGKVAREYMIREFDTEKQISKLERVLLNCCGEKG